ncbi:MAG: hypothetical protein KJ811_05495 [Candidatus Margulisbacteria bacterium]|nr:hypothetical protein [Candidatus Margulisiibacteriota bacterium]
MVILEGLGRPNQHRPPTDIRQTRPVPIGEDPIDTYTPSLDDQSAGVPPLEVSSSRPQHIDPAISPPDIQPEPVQEPPVSAEIAAQVSQLSERLEEVIPQLACLSPEAREALQAELQEISPGLPEDLTVASQSGNERALAIVGQRLFRLGQLAQLVANIENLQEQSSSLPPPERELVQSNIQLITQLYQRGLSQLAQDNLPAFEETMGEIELVSASLRSYVTLRDDAEATALRGEYATALAETVADADGNGLARLTLLSTQESFEEMSQASWMTEEGRSEFTEFAQAQLEHLAVCYTDPVTAQRVIDAVSDRYLEMQRESQITQFDRLATGFDRLGEINPDDESWQALVSQGYAQLQAARGFFEGGQIEDGGELFEQAVSIFDQLQQRANQPAQFDQLEARFEIYSRSGRRDESWQTLIRQGRSQVQTARELLQRGQLEESRQAFTQAESISQRAQIIRHSRRAVGNLRQFIDQPEHSGFNQLSPTFGGRLRSMIHRAQRRFEGVIEGAFEGETPAAELGERFDQAASITRRVDVQFDSAQTERTRARCRQFLLQIQGNEQTRTQVTSHHSENLAVLQRFIDRDESATLTEAKQAYQSIESHLQRWQVLARITDVRAVLQQIQGERTSIVPALGRAAVRTVALPVTGAVGRSPTLTNLREVAGGGNPQEAPSAASVIANGILGTLSEPARVAAAEYFQAQRREAQGRTDVAGARSIPQLLATLERIEQGVRAGTYSRASYRADMAELDQVISQSGREVHPAVDQAMREIDFLPTFARAAGEVGSQMAAHLFIPFYETYSEYQRTGSVRFSTVAVDTVLAPFQLCGIGGLARMARLPMVAGRAINATMRAMRLARFSQAGALSLAGRGGRFASGLSRAAEFGRGAFGLYQSAAMFLMPRVFAYRAYDEYTHQRAQYQSGERTTPPEIPYATIAASLIGWGIVSRFGGQAMVTARSSMVRMRYALAPNRSLTVRIGQLRMSLASRAEQLEAREAVFSTGGRGVAVTNDAESITQLRLLRAEAEELRALMQVARDRGIVSAPTQAEPAASGVSGALPESVVRRGAITEVEVLLERSLPGQEEVLLFLRRRGVTEENMAKSLLDLGGELRMTFPQHSNEFASRLVELRVNYQVRLARPAAEVRVATQAASQQWGVIRNIPVNGGGRYEVLFNGRDRIAINRAGRLDGEAVTFHVRDVRQIPAEGEFITVRLPGERFFLEIRMQNGGLSVTPMGENPLIASPRPRSRFDTNWHFDPSLEGRILPARDLQGIHAPAAPQVEPVPGRRGFTFEVVTPPQPIPQAQPAAQRVVALEPGSGGTAAIRAPRPQVQPAPARVVREYPQELGDYNIEIGTSGRRGVPVAEEALESTRATRAARPPRAVSE